MAYQLEYEFRDIKRNYIKKNKQINALIAALLLAIGVSAVQFGGASLEMILLGKHKEVRTASAQMVIHLREGMAFDEAVAVFCDEIGFENTEN